MSLKGYQQMAISTTRTTCKGASQHAWNHNATHEHKAACSTGQTLAVQLLLLLLLLPAIYRSKAQWTFIGISSPEWPARYTVMYLRSWPIPLAAVLPLLMCSADHLVRRRTCSHRYRITA